MYEIQIIQEGTVITCTYLTHFCHTITIPFGEMYGSITMKMAKQYLLGGPLNLNSAWNNVPILGI